MSVRTDSFRPGIIAGKRPSRTETVRASVADVQFTLLLTIALVVLVIYVFLRSWRNLGRYQPSQGSLVSWLLSIAHNRAIDELRSRRGKDARREVSDEDLQPQAVIDPGFDEALLRGEVQGALADLPPAQREVIELVFWGGLTRREIADRLDLPLGTVHTRLRLGMDKLRGMLRRLADDSEDE